MELTDLAVGQRASRVPVLPDPYFQAMCEVVVLRRALIAAYPNVISPTEDEQTNVPDIVQARADAGKGISPDYPLYSPQPPASKDFPYVPVDLQEVRREIEEIRANILVESGHVERFTRLTRLVDILASNVVHAIARDHEFFPPIDVFIERNFELISTLSSDFLKAIQPCIESLGRHVFDLSRQRLSIYDFARRYGIDSTDPRFPDYLHRPISLEEATAVVRHFFTIADRSSPFHRAAVGALMLLQQMPLALQRYPYDNANSPLCIDNQLDEVEDAAIIAILEAQPSPYRTAGERQLTEFIRWYSWWDEGMDCPHVRELIQEMFDLFVSSAPMTQRYGSDLIRRMYSPLKVCTDPEDPLRKQPIESPTSLELASFGSDFHTSIKHKLLDSAQDYSDMLFRDPEFQSMALFKANDYMPSLRAVEVYSEITEMGKQHQHPVEFSVKELVAGSLGKIVSMFELLVHHTQARYARPISPQDLQRYFTFEYHVSSALHRPLGMKGNHTRESCSDLPLLEYEARRLIRAGQLDVPCIDLTRSIMRVVYDTCYPDRYGENGFRMCNLTPDDKAQEVLANSLHAYLNVRQGFPEALPTSESFAPEIPADAVVNYQGVDRLRTWLQNVLPGILKMEGDLLWAIDFKTPLGDIASESFYQCLRMRIGIPETPIPVSLADVILAFQMSKYIVAVARECDAGETLTRQSLLPEQRREIIERLIDNPSPQRATYAASLRAVIRGLKYGTPQPELFEELKEIAPRERLSPLGIALYMLERDLAITSSELDNLRVEPGLLVWNQHVSTARASDRPPHHSFFDSINSFGDFDLWAPYVSVKEAFKLHQLFAHAMDDESSGPLLREFLHASRRLKVPCNEDPGLEELFSLPAETVADRFKDLVRKTQNSLASVPARISFEKPLDVILVSEALKRNRAPSRLSTIDIVELHQFSLVRDKVSPLPEYATQASASLPIRRKQRESLRAGSSFLKLFEFCDLVGTNLTYVPAEHTPETTRLLKSAAVRLLQTIETRHFSIKNHQINSDTFVATRDNLVYANNLLEALFDSINGASGESTWALQPDVRREIWTELNIDNLLKEVDSCFIEYQGLPETKNHRVLEFVPTRGILMEFAGDICGTCVSRLNFLSENSSEAFFVSFIRGRKAHETSEPSKRPEGGAFVFRGTLQDGRPTLVIRGFNPSHALINEVSVGELFERFADVVATWGSQAGVPTVSIPDDSFWGSALTNRRYAFLYLRNIYSASSSVGLVPSQVSDFNGCGVTHVKVVRS